MAGYSLQPNLPSLFVPVFADADGTEKARLLPHGFHELRESNHASIIIPPLKIRKESKGYEYNY